MRYDSVSDNFREYGVKRSIFVSYQCTASEVMAFIPILWRDCRILERFSI